MYSYHQSKHTCRICPQQSPSLMQTHMTNDNYISIIAKYGAIQTVFLHKTTIYLKDMDYIF